MKAVFSLESEIIPPNICFEKTNPRIPAKWNLVALSWPLEGLQRASTNSLGYGGSNAHVVMDDAYHYLSMHELKGKRRTLKSPQIEVLHGLGLTNCHTNSNTVANEANRFVKSHNKENDNSKASANVMFSEASMDIQMDI